MKEVIKKMLRYEMTGVKIRSRQGEYAQEEMGSLYHYNKERTSRGSMLLCMVKIPLLHSFIIAGSPFWIPKMKKQKVSWLFFS